MLIQKISSLESLFSKLPNYGLYSVNICKLNLASSVEMHSAVGTLFFPKALTPH